MCLRSTTEPRYRSLLLVLCLAFLPADPINAASCVGQPGSASLDDGSFFLTARFYYASLSTAESTATIRQPDGSTRSIPVFEEWLQQGFHGLVIGYRRGWWGDGGGSPGGEAEISTQEAQRFETATDMALEDAQDAWAHYNTNSQGHGRWFSGQAVSKVFVDHGKTSPFSDPLAPG